MTTFVALLRGINVGKHHRIPMAALRGLMTGLGFEDVHTHLQSGNVVFTGGRRRPDAVAAAITRQIKADHGFDIAVLVRTAAELAAVVERDPFRGVADDPSRYLVTFLSAAPPKAAVPAVPEPNQVRVHGREMYLWCPDGVLALSFDTKRWEREHGLVATARNWRTVVKLAELAGR